MVVLVVTRSVEPKKSDSLRRCNGYGNETTATFVVSERSRWCVESSRVSNPRLNSGMAHVVSTRVPGTLHLSHKVETTFGFFCTTDSLDPVTSFFQKSRFCVSISIVCIGFSTISLTEAIEC
jgi:hypothetical protein